MRLDENMSLCSYNTFGIDVRARFFAVINNKEELFDLVSLQEAQKYPKLILGGGTNILFTRDVDGVVIKSNISGIEKTREDENSIVYKVGSGVIWDDFVRFCAERDLYGCENLSWIPGSVGAAPLQNIGAYGTEAKEIILRVNGIHLEDLKEVSFSNRDCDFSYRNSVFKEKYRNTFFITSVEFALQKGGQIRFDYPEIKEEIDRRGLGQIGPAEIRKILHKLRNQKLPDIKELGNAGSFFKNPEITREEYNNLLEVDKAVPGYKIPGDKIKISAGYLIEKCGWKGKELGPCGVYRDHALVLVNLGGATGSDIKKLSEKIILDVLKKYNVKLDPEVNIY